MGFAALGCVGKTSLMMDLIAQRQRALGSNLANVDTPGYVRRDIDFSQYLGGSTAALETKLAQKLVHRQCLIMNKMLKSILPMN